MTKHKHVEPGNRKSELAVVGLVVSAGLIDWVDRLVTVAGWVAGLW
ncbi:hypothetical protein [Nocardioides sp. AX2bis]|nr:hypothetical protein [Nocardioides sp. AX2bis]